jgi:small subunit ribosomal protein S6
LEAAAKNVVNKLYEGMFLVDSALATADWEGVLAAIRTILEKAGAQIISLAKWDERKLAYTIRGKTRGTYILSYFKAPGPKITEIERDVQLSEKIVRALILSAEQIPPANLEKETPAMKAERERQRPPAPSAHPQPKQGEPSSGEQMATEQPAK